MIMIMMMKIMLKIKIKNINKILKIESIWMIILKNNNYNTNKLNTYKKQNTYRGKSKQ